MVLSEINSTSFQLCSYTLYPLSMLNTHKHETGTTIKINNNQLDCSVRLYGIPNNYCW